MSEYDYSSEIGVSEATASTLDRALKKLGQKDENGDNIGIVYVKSGVVQAIPVAIRTLGLIVLVAMIFFRQPFTWLEVLPITKTWFLAFTRWEVFSVTTWSLAVVFYLSYFALSMFRNNIVSGIKGVEIHFQKHKEIVRTIKAGEFGILMNPYVKPYAVVNSKKYFPLIFDEVEGSTRDQFSLFYKGAIMMRVVDTYKLLERGGFEPFVKQLKKFYQAYMNDTMLGVDGKNFATFQIDPLNSGRNNANVDALDQISQENLSIDLISKLSEIDEVDVSQIPLDESNMPERMQLVDAINNIAKDYGLECSDHIPQGSRPRDSFFEEQAVPLVTTIQRLVQAVAQLKDIIEEEADADRAAAVAAKKIGAMQILKIISEMEAVTDSLKEEGNIETIVDSKRAAMINKAESIIGPVKLKLEGLQAQVSAEVVTTTGIERYRRELDEIMVGIESELDSLIPDIQNVTVGDMEESNMIPNIDIIDILMKKTGTNAVLDALKGNVEESAKKVEDNNTDTDSYISELLAKVNKIDIEKLMGEVQESVSALAGDSGVSTKGFTLKDIEKRISTILSDADITTSAEEGQEIMPVPVEGGE